MVLSCLEERSANSDLTLFGIGSRDLHADGLKKGRELEWLRRMPVAKEINRLTVRNGNGGLGVFLLFPFLFLRADRDNGSGQIQAATKLRLRRGGGSLDRLRGLGICGAHLLVR